MKLRVYLDKFLDGQVIWSVDEGTIETEQTFSEVLLFDVNGITRSNLNSDNIKEPKCWIEVEGILIITGSVAAIRHSG